jgi:DNA-3-methyladenine glycosylase I
VIRCAWCGSDPEYLRYHDEEWGFPVADDRYLFEKICLEGFQAGLSWLTILRKRPAFRRAFAGFEIARLARFDGRQVARLLRDPGIVRHRGKIVSVLNNARRARELVEEYGSLAGYLWCFEPPGPQPSRGPTLALMRRRTESAESRALARDLRRRGWTYVGPTTLYALFQAVGLVNHHLEGCAIRPRVEAARRGFVRPAPSAAQPPRSSPRSAGSP